MRRITTMHLDVVKKIPKECTKECLFITYLHNDRIRLVKKPRLRARFAKKYTQLSVMINPNKTTELPDEIVQFIKEFHEKINNLDLHQNRNKTINLIKYTIYQLNKTLQEWNHNHSEDKPVRLNLTIAFTYGDHLIMFNFGNNPVYIYREGDLATFKGSRLDTEKHFSLKTGRKGKVEYMLFEKQVPPIGEVDFTTDQIMALFKITHRLLKGDMLSIIAENSILPHKFRVNVNLFEHAIEKSQMLKLLKLSRNEEHPGYSWILMTFDEVREFRQTVRYTLFRTLKGLLTCLLLLTTLAAPSIYRQQVQIDSTPVMAFQRPPTTGHITVLLEEESDAFGILPGISATPTQDTVEDPGIGPEVHSISKLFSDALDTGEYMNLASYYPYSIEPSEMTFHASDELLIEFISETYYGSKNQSDLIRVLNPGLNYRSIADAEVYLPIFSVAYETSKEIPYTSALTLADISMKFYSSAQYIEYLKAVNGLDSNIIPSQKTILVPPLNIYPVQEEK